MSRLRTFLRWLGVIGPLALAGCSNTVALAARIPPAAACHKKASEFIQTAKTCADAQTLANASEDCQRAYPGGLDFNCKEMP
ncbi:MAG: hypothetical protein V4529_16635 [Gemmatimonadota bacterium]